MTVRDATKLMNVSERMVYMAGRVLRSGREDIIAAVERGELSINAAIKIIEGRADSPPDRFAALVKAWNLAAEGDRERFLAALGDGLVVRP